ncbi:MAG TPA: Tol-Pal system beta propeller repeat protein TolB [Kofleriaceae bacterium]|nr:Tol-Pal system beta propeller repeat protein TolB [Kofleriaceae bacterium]
MIRVARPALAVLSVAAGDALAQGGAVIDIKGAQRVKYPLAIPPAADGDTAVGRTVHEVANFDMRVAGWFKPLDGSGYAGDLRGEGLGIDVAKWKDTGAFGVMKFKVSGGGSSISIDFRLYEVEKGDRAVLQRTYKGSSADARKLTHMWCNEVVKHMTGEPGFFGSKIAFVTKTGRRSKAVMAMDFDGHGPYSVSKNRSINILPAWSPSGGKIAFTSYMRDNPDLYVASAGGGRPVRTSYRYGMNTGASWSPDGSKIALTLSKDGNPEIYVIDSFSGKILRRLTNNRAIDSGAAWSPDGSQIAFVSDREGGPQIFVMNADGSGQRRVSMNGNYNTTPAWNPRKGTRQLAYTTRADKTFDIVTLDLASGKMVRITQGEGVNEEPSWAPNGRAIAFASTRPGGAGVYIANADGTGDAVRVWKGTPTSVDWGPAPAQ